ncbi:MAG TPA: hypothetical protein VFP68_12995 [Burkholderiaceae bacterium]|nr:hypothetical protein [Burkholderiaceae bacterium]
MNADDNEEVMLDMEQVLISNDKCDGVTISAASISVEWGAPYLGHDAA